MTALLRAYDGITSNQTVSIGITVVATGWCFYKTFARRCSGFDAASYVIGLCAGSALSLLANTLHTYNNREERNTIHASLSLLIGFIPLHHHPMIRYAMSYITRTLGDLGDNELRYGFATGFLMTNLYLQVIPNLKFVRCQQCNAVKFL